MWKTLLTGWTWKIKLYSWQWHEVLLSLPPGANVVVGVVGWPYGMMGTYSDNIQYAGDGRVDQVLLWGRGVV